MKRILVWLLAAAFLFCGCHYAAQPETAPKKQPISDTKPAIDEISPTADPSVSSAGQLMGKADTVEDAEEIAALYGIELVRHNHGVAVYHTDEDPKEVIRRGEENGWPQLTLNRTVQLY